MGNTWGRLFRVTTWGESHGAGVGAVVDGCPARLALSEADIQPDLDRRVPGQSAIVTQRKETDTVRILSGVFEGQTLGTPIRLAGERDLAVTVAPGLGQHTDEILTELLEYSGECVAALRQQGVVT